MNFPVYRTTSFHYSRGRKLGDASYPPNDGMCMPFPHREGAGLYEVAPTLDPTAGKTAWL